MKNLMLNKNAKIIHQLHKLVYDAGRIEHIEVYEKKLNLSLTP